MNISEILRQLEAYTNPYVDIAGICFGTDGCAKIIVDTIRKMEESENE